VFFENTLVGGNLMVPFGRKLLLEWGAFSEAPKFRKYPLAHLADWESIVWARNNGFQTLDFSGYWLDRGEDDPINHYKSGFSKTIIGVTPEYDYASFSPLTRLFLRIAKPIRTAAFWQPRRRSR
jgi:lipid II:glycine glycyltransferase (peptidoglycan interpeptide bridge formation enzyme)